MTSLFADGVAERMLAHRIVLLGEEINDDVANRVCAQLLLLDADDPGSDIHLYLNSPGGSVTAGMAIYDTMQSISPEVATCGLGMVASMGQFLLSSGAPGKRTVLPRARVMMHQPHGGVGGTADEVLIRAEVYKAHRQELAELTAEQTGQTVERVLADGDRDRWFSAREAVEYGLADKVLQRSAQ
ncbi:ClpP family protease [Allokutzneria sp. NRRL B-24872]|uniref:ClpP family protease n=1 Tax=Allokutzneria sp. NRRL B-24872 TaxID=1137961 RepID=UPI000A394AC7|nr:ATP-dependent Clp protease proteolytic subunit [Allokutzneria sp. NRRL B-24872]